MTPSIPAIAVAFAPVPCEDALAGPDDALAGEPEFCEAETALVIDVARLEAPDPEVGLVSARKYRQQRPQENSQNEAQHVE